MMIIASPHITSHDVLPPHPPPGPYSRVTYCELYRVAFNTLLLNFLLTWFFGLTEQFAARDDDARAAEQQAAQQYAAGGWLTSSSTGAASSTAAAGAAASSASATTAAAELSGAPLRDDVSGGGGGVSTSVRHIHDMWSSDDAWLRQHAYVAAIAASLLLLSYLLMRAELSILDLTGRSATRQDLRRWILTAYLQMSDAAAASPLAEVGKLFCV